MSEGKRGKSLVAPQASKKRNTTSLLTWVRDAMKECSGLNIELDIADDAMSTWNVIFTSDMFASTTSSGAASTEFEVLGDNGWIPLRNELGEVFIKLLDASSVLGDGTTCYQVGDAWYEARVQNGNLVQKNLQTDVERQIRKVDTADKLKMDILTWFQKYGKDRKPGVHLQLRFPPNFPSSPPFVRVVCPRFHFQTGRVTVGGSMCSETLTMSGWDPKITPIAFLLVLKEHIVEGEGRIDMSSRYDYTEKEAEEAFKRSAQTHGWKI